MFRYIGSATRQPLDCPEMADAERRSATFLTYPFATNHTDLVDAGFYYRGNL